MLLVDRVRALHGLQSRYSCLLLDSLLVLHSNVLVHPTLLDLHSPRPHPARHRRSIHTGVQPARAAARQWRSAQRRGRLPEWGAQRRERGSGVPALPGHQGGDLGEKYGPGGGEEGEKEGWGGGQRVGEEAGKDKWNEAREEKRWAARGGSWRKGVSGMPMRQPLPARQRFAFEIILAM